jgi:hypothetical protein
MDVGGGFEDFQFSTSPHFSFLRPASGYLRETTEQIKVAGAA